MVAEMANCEAASCIEHGDGDVPTSGNKDSHTESDSSSSAENTGTSTDDSSGEEENEEEDEEEDEDSANAGREEEGEAEASSPESEVQGPNRHKGNDERPFKPCCEKCKAIQQSHGNELVTPRRISKGRFQVQLEGEGTYECTVTGLVFEASEPVLVRYSVLSWTKFGAFLQDSWKFAGPIFNVDTVKKDASVLKSIQFPHSVCLADPENEMTFSVLHIKDNRPIIEPTVDHSGSHVKWRVTSLSPVGPIIQTSQSVERHGVVLIYKQMGSDNNNSYSFHIYLATNSQSDIKASDFVRCIYKNCMGATGVCVTDIRNQVKGYKNRYICIEKPPTCKLDEGTYRLVSEPEGEVKPQDLKFTLAVTKMKGYFEVFFEHPPPFNLSLKDTNTDEAVWEATIRKEDCEEKRAKKRPNSTERSSPEEKTIYKRPRWHKESDGGKTVMTQGQDMSERQLLQVATQLGNMWKQVAIYLDLNTMDLDNIQAAEEDVIMQRLKMLVKWKSKKQPGEATASNLWETLKELDGLPIEVGLMLKGMMSNRSAK